MTQSEDELHALFSRYRAACPDVEPGPGFMPGLWAKLERRDNFWSVFGRVGRPFAAASAAACLLLGLLLQIGTFGYRDVLSYPDALAAAPSGDTSLFSAN